MSGGVYGAPQQVLRGEVVAPTLPYAPPLPKCPADWPIGVIGCGGITRNHLAAYRHAGFRVEALSSRSSERAEALRAEFFPRAQIFADWRELLRCESVRVVDVTTHPEVRPPIIEAALRAGKHTLSQKPLALELAPAKRLIAVAGEAERHLVVNQNGRWAPHFAWMREAVRKGLIGHVSSVNFTVEWDHHWICGTAFEEVSELLLSDFAIHWFDLACCFFGNRSAESVFAASQSSGSQRARPPFLVHACAEFEGGQATFAFNADAVHGQEDRTSVVGSRGVLRSVGSSLLDQRVTMTTAEGSCSPELTGSWFLEGFIGTMGELLSALEENRDPLNSARDNLRSLALCFAAVQSARTGSACRVIR